MKGLTPSGTTEGNHSSLMALIIMKDRHQDHQKKKESLLTLDKRKIITNHTSPAKAMADLEPVNNRRFNNITVKEIEEDNLNVSWSIRRSKKDLLTQMVANQRVERHHQLLLLTFLF